MKWFMQLPWMKVAKELGRQIDQDDVFNGAAVLGFYLTLAVFPALIFLLSLLPYLPIRYLDDAIMELLGSALPEAAADLLEETVRRIVSERQGGLLSFGFLGMLWAASTGMVAVMHQLNNTYNVKEARPFLKARATAILLTLLFGTVVIGTFALIVLGGVLQAWLARFVGLSPILLTSFASLRWGIILAALLFGIALVYHLAPNTERPLKWLTPGAIFAVVGIMAASLAFQLYIEHFANYEATYGAIGAVIMLMLWFYVVGLVLLLGSEINVVIEHFRSDAPPSNKQASLG
ncbi:MAG: YihY/virulence factor BrkB family protein [Patescibacteria group bacterium]|nr:YihY/virulence factor BrkB family protein [Patescibacteria group bacterium]